MRFKFEKMKENLFLFKITYFSRSVVSQEARDLILVQINREIFDRILLLARIERLFD